MSGAGILVEALSLSLGAFTLRRLDLALEAGEILVILGPNGAGKSVSLEAIAGFHRCRSGRIEIAGREVTHLPPERRNVALMVQDYGLFPHLTVAANVGLGVRAGPARDIAALLGEFGIAHLAARRPQRLSPGEKQRTALARALAARPDLFLFDEPFSALDAPTRDELRDELHRSLRQIRIPAIFVTHDRTDAAVLADKIIVLDRGTMMQSGTASDILRRPANEFVARCVGVENILPGRVAMAGDGRSALAVGGRMLEAGPLDPAVAALVDVALCIRAEDVALSVGGAPQAAGVNRLSARIIAIRDLGPLSRLELDCGFRLKAYAMARQIRDLRLAPGGAVTAEIEAGAIHVMARGESSLLPPPAGCE